MRKTEQKVDPQTTDNFFKKGPDMPILEDDLQEKKARNMRNNVIFATAILGFLFAFTRMGIVGQNDLSHFMAAESLMNRGTRIIDECPALFKQEVRDGEYRWSMVDIVKYKGHFYSSKPPVLNYILAGEALVLRKLGLPIGFRDKLERAYTGFILTLLTVGLMTALGGAAFRKVISKYTDDEWEATLLTILTLFGTLYLTYSVTLNHHTITATFILISFFLLGMHEARKELNPKHVLLAGFLMALGVTIDCGHGFIFSIAFALYLMIYVRSWKYILLFALGSIPPLAWHCIVQYQTFHTILPVQFYRDLYEFEGGLLRGKRGFDIPRWKYWALTLFSTRGLFTASPILLFGIWGIGHEIRKGSQYIYPVISVLFGCTLLFLYYSFLAPKNFCGACYGFRWYIGFMPLLAFFAARYFLEVKDRHWRRRIFYVLGFISVVSALVGTRAPWTYMENFIHPLARLLLLFRGF
jgi:hypothetical protein